MLKHTFQRRWPTLASLLLLLSISPLAGFGPGPKGVEQSYTPAAEAAIAREKIAVEPATLLVRVKGLICETCGYGIYRKVRGVDGVDIKRFKKGAQIDIHTQFVTIGLKDGAPIDLPKLFKAVEDAGYEPISAYLIADGQAQSATYRVAQLKADLLLGDAAEDQAMPQLIAVRPLATDAEKLIVTLYPST